MPWVPIHESGVSFDFSAENGPTISGSTVEATSGGAPEQQWWQVIIQGGAQRVRVRIVSMDTGPYPYEGYFDFGGEVIAPERNYSDIVPNPVEPTSPTRHIAYYAGEQSDYPAESYTMVVEVLQGLIANDDEATTNADTPVTVDVLANDTFGDEPVALDQLEGPPTIHQQPANGTVSVAPDGKITYTPNPGFTGTDEFVYRIAMPRPSDPEECTTVVFDGGGSNEAFQVGSASKLPEWFDPESPITLTFDGIGEATYSESPLWGMVLTSGDVFYSPMTGTGMFSQGGNTVCLNWRLGGDE